LAAPHGERVAVSVLDAELLFNFNKAGDGLLQILAAATTTVLIERPILIQCFIGLAMRAGERA